MYLGPSPEASPDRNGSILCFVELFIFSFSAENLLAEGSNPVRGLLFVALSKLMVDKYLTAMRNPLATI